MAIIVLLFAQVDAVDRNRVTILLDTLYIAVEVPILATREAVLQEIYIIASIIHGTI